MSSSGESGNPYAPKLPSHVIWLEHAAFTGNNIGEIFYGTHLIHHSANYIDISHPSLQGMLIILYFETIAALLSPFHRKGQSIKWGLVGYSTVMFGLVTTFTAMNVWLQQLSYIDNREFPGVPGTLPPGPIGWSLFMYSKPLVIIPNACFIIANWMADGLLVSTTVYLSSQVELMGMTRCIAVTCFTTCNVGS